MSGGCLIDKAGFVVGVMVENVYLKQGDDAPSKAYGQAIPIECFDDAFPRLWVDGQLTETRPNTKATA